MLEQELKRDIWARMQEIKEDISILWSILLAVDHAMKTGFNIWDVYESAVHGLAEQACTLQEELASLARLLKETGAEAE